MTANNIPANVKKNIFSENIYPDWEIDEKFFIDIAKKILKWQKQSCRTWKLLRIFSQIR